MFYYIEIHKTPRRVIYYGEIFNKERKREPQRKELINNKL